MEVIIQSNYESVSKLAATIIQELIEIKPHCVLGLATGSTPLGLYKELIRMHVEDGLDFSKVTTFNLDEYYGLTPTHPQSYHYFMNEYLFDHINIPETQRHLPDGTTDTVGSFCKEYENRIRDHGGIDLQILGLGGDGHIGFNEPGSSLASRTRLKTLMQETIKDNARFFDSEDEVPKFAITMGVGTILDAKFCLLLCSGEKKAEILAQAVEGPVTASVTASALQMHPKTTVIADEAAASKLRYREYYRYIQEVRPADR